MRQPDDGILLSGVNSFQFPSFWECRMRASTGHEEIEYECLAESGVTGELSRPSMQCPVFAVPEGAIVQLYCTIRPDAS